MKHTSQRCFSTTHRRVHGDVVRRGGSLQGERVACGVSTLNVLQGLAGRGKQLSLRSPSVSASARAASRGSSTHIQSVDDMRTHWKRGEGELTEKDALHWIGTSSDLHFHTSVGLPFRFLFTHQFSPPSVEFFTT